MITPLLRWWWGRLASDSREMHASLPRRNRRRPLKAFRPGIFSTCAPLRAQCSGVPCAGRAAL
eukprot:2264125-Alexandrium_andersonii.AAC.1